MPYKTGKLKGELTTPEIRKLVKAHNKLNAITFPKGSKREDIIQIVNKRGFKIDHEKQSIIPTTRPRNKKINLKKAESILPKPKTKLEKQKAKEEKEEKQIVKKKESRAKTKEIVAKAIKQDRKKNDRKKIVKDKKQSNIKKEMKGDDKVVENNLNFIDKLNAEKKVEKKVEKKEKVEKEPKRINKELEITLNNALLNIQSAVEEVQDTQLEDMDKDEKKRSKAQLRILTRLIDTRKTKGFSKLEKNEIKTALDRYLEIDDLSSENEKKAKQLQKIIFKQS